MGTNLLVTTTKDGCLGSANNIINTNSYIIITASMVTNNIGQCFLVETRPRLRIVARAVPAVVARRSQKESVSFEKKDEEC